MRLFVALDINDEIRCRIARFLEGVCGFAPEVRWVRPESLHVTLKFIGEKSAEKAEEIERALRTISAETIDIAFRGYGFFPNARAPRLFWIGVEAGSKLAWLAAAVDKSLTALEVPPEGHSFNAHLTLARGGTRSHARKGGPRREEASFQHLQAKLGALPPPEFGTMTAREFFLYQSQTLPSGSRYTKLASFSLH